MRSEIQELRVESWELRCGQGGNIPGVDAHGAEVQPVFGLEDERLRADLQDGRRLHGRGHAEERQLRWHQRPIL